MTLAARHLRLVAARLDRRRATRSAAPTTATRRSSSPTVRRARRRRRARARPSRTRSSRSTSRCSGRSLRSSRSTARTCSGGASAPRAARRRLHAAIAAALALTTQCSCGCTPTTVHCVGGRRRSVSEVGAGGGGDEPALVEGAGLGEGDDAAAEAGAGEAGADDAGGRGRAGRRARRAPGSTPRSRRGATRGSRPWRAPTATRSPAGSAAATSRTRCVLGDDVAGPAAQHRVVEARRPPSGSVSRRSGPEHRLGRVDRRLALGVGGAGQLPRPGRSGSPGPRRRRARRSGVTVSVVAVDQQGVARRRPAADASWSMIPHGTPDARCSARWVSWASSSVEPSKPEREGDGHLERRARREAGADRQRGGDVRR